MRFAHFFIDRPVFAAVLSIVTVIIGALAILSLPIAQYPDIAPPTVTISASYPGANAKTVAETVATPIEEQINGVEGMLYMSSQSTNDGTMVLTVTFKLGTDLDIAQVQVQNRVSIALPLLPFDVQPRGGLWWKKASPNITLGESSAVYSPDGSRDPLYVSNYATLQLKDELARLPGVGDMTIFGARDYSMRLWLNPEQLASRSLTAGDVISAVQEQNVQVAAGIVGGPPLPPGKAPFQYTINTLGRLIEPQQFGEIVVKTGADGSVTRMKDVARVELGAADYTTNTHYNGLPAVGIGIFQLPGSNSIATADAIYKKLKELKEDFPAGIAYAIPYDTTTFVRDSIRDVTKTLFEAIGLVALVVMVFLQNWRASIVPLLAIPVSLIGTFAVMAVFGFSLNNLSMFGLVLAIGIVVDDAIVVVENVDRWIEQGLSPRDASYRALEEVTPAIVAIAFGLTAVVRPRRLHQRDYWTVLPAVLRLTISLLDAPFSIQFADAEPRSGRGWILQAAQGQARLADRGSSIWAAGLDLPPVRPRTGEAERGIHRSIATGGSAVDRGSWRLCLPAICDVSGISIRFRSASFPNRIKATCSSLWFWFGRLVDRPHRRGAQSHVGHRD